MSRIQDRAEELVEQGVDVNEAMAIAHEESQMALEHRAESASADADEPEGEVESLGLWDKILDARIQHLKGEDG